MHAIQREIDGESFYHRGVVESSLIDVVAPAHRRTTYQKSVEFLLRGSALLKGESYKILKKPSISAKAELNIRQAAAAFKLLKRTDFYDIMAATLNAEAKRR